jgi:hypothetical protein
MNFNNFGVGGKNLNTEIKNPTPIIRPLDVYTYAHFTHKGIQSLMIHPNNVNGLAMMIDGGVLQASHLNWSMDGAIWLSLG